MDNIFYKLKFQTKHLAFKIITILFIAVSICAITYGLGNSYSIPFEEFTVNPYSPWTIPEYMGLLQKLGMFLWISAGAVCFFSYTLKEPKDTFFLVAGLISSIFAMDELYLLHNKMLPIYAGIPQNIVYAVYLIMILYFIYYFRYKIIKSEFLLLIISLLFMGIKVAIDSFQNLKIIPEDKNGFIEDTSKLVGIVFWFYYLVRFAYFQVRREIKKGG